MSAVQRLRRRLDAMTSGVRTATVERLCRGEVGTPATPGELRSAESFYAACVELLVIDSERPDLCDSERVRTTKQRLDAIRQRLDRRSAREALK